MAWYLVLLFLEAIAFGADVEPLTEKTPTAQKEVEEIEVNLPRRSLYVRSFPGLDGINSNIYQVYMQPFSFFPQPLVAVTNLAGEGGSGRVLLTQTQPGGPLLIQGNLTGLSPGLHGFNVHVFGDLTDGCESAGPHFNPDWVTHGGPGFPIRHAGDLGNIRADDSGNAQIEIIEPLLSLLGPRNILGRSLHVHASEDDMGRTGNRESPVTGNSGPSVACGVIALMQFRPENQPPPPTPPLPPPLIG